MRLSPIALLSIAVLLLACNKDGTGPDGDQLLDVLFNFCASPPAFAAIQTEPNGAWTAIGTPNASGQVTVELPEKFGLVEVFQAGGTVYQTNVFFMTRDELAIPTSCPSTTLKSVNGSITALTTGQEVQVQMADRSAFLFAGAAATFQLTNLRDGAKDLLAQRRAGTSLLTDKVIVRRGENPAAGSTMAQLDFNAAVAPASGAVTITGLVAGDQRSTFGIVHTTGEGRAFFNSPPASLTSGTVYGLPASLMASTDMHEIGLYSYNAQLERGVHVFRRTMGDVTINAGPAISTPTTTVVATNPGKRLRLQLPSQADYGGIVQFATYHAAGGRYITVTTTSAYLGSTPTTWDVQIPDFSGVTGFPSAAQFSPSATVSWDVYVAGETHGFFRQPVNIPDGTVHKWAALYSSSALTATRTMPSGRTAQGVNRR